MSGKGNDLEEPLNPDTSEFCPKRNDEVYQFLKSALPSKWKNAGALFVVMGTLAFTMYQGVRGGLKSKVECCSLEEGDSGPCSIKICEATGFIATNKGLTVDFFAVKVAGVWDMSWGGFTSHELQPITVESEISDTSMVMILGPLAIMAFLMFEVELIWISLANMQRVYITLLSYGLYIGNHKYGAFVQMIIFIITVGLVGGFQLFAFSAATNDEPLHVQITANSTDVYLRFPTSVAESIVNDGQSSQKGTNDMLYSAMIMVFGFLSFTYSIYMAHADIYSPVALKSLLKQGMKGDGAGIAAFLMTLRKIESTQFAKAMKRTSSKGCSSSIEPFSEFVKDRTKLEKAIGAVLESLDGGRNVASGSGVNQG